jgi:intracellular sulfur oxidation DsrE/DsrF family protein
MKVIRISDQIATCQSSLYHFVSFPVTVLILLCLPAWAHSQQAEPSMGPVIKNFGRVYDIAGSYGLESHVHYRAVMDVSTSPDSSGELNRAIESAARFLNMSARAGVSPSKLKLALVLHGAAGKDALSSEAYRSRFGSDNPNDDLLNALARAGVDIYLCGQTAGFRGYERRNLHASVTMATSAMSVLTRLQAEGWSLLP